MRMEEDRSHITERILNLTLEIIYLLTGESGDHMTITVPPCDSPQPERHNMQKILEITKKMMELLTGEDTMVESSSYRNPPERCPRPLYSRDSTHEDHTIPHHHQGEDLTNVKVEDEVEERYVRDDQQYTEEAGMMRTFKEEDTPTEISTGHTIKEPSKDHLALPPGCKMKEEDITRDCAGEKTMRSAADGGLHSVYRLSNPSDSEQPLRDDVGIQGKEKFSCPECGECFSSELSLTAHQRSHMDEKVHSCSDAGNVLHRNQFLLDI
ncbi:hypothetical protein AB205_0142970 [Aquarana catesbeiana]|uniref:C2H2-type domain-containing protein n=1 Tax=Aquarana catesbeiana TaxID=8400 RepID=A0A2G9RHW3_AQUCT|nr:hypothetical protein AB205_0142970 [Aquarana catesbeiana]